MGKKKHGLGRSLVKDRFGGPKRGKSNESFLHTSELEDGYDWGRLNLQSVTEQSQLDEFLSTAELAGTEFTAEKLNVTFVNPEVGAGLLSSEELKHVEKLHEEHRDLLCIPRRPVWDDSTSASELDRMERDTFLEWRRGLSELQEDKGIIMTPFEKNLDFWRQLWRVIERSDIVVQIVDARNPELFRCEDLEKYVKEVGVDKTNLILINKADLLTQVQRDKWAQHYSTLGVRVAFWSAVLETERIESRDSNTVNKLNRSDNDKDIGNESGNDSSDDDDDEDDSEVGDNDRNSILESGPVKFSSQAGLSELKTGENVMMENLCLEEDDQANCASAKLESVGESVGTVGDGSVVNSSDLLNGDQLLKLFRSLHSGNIVQGNHIVTVGMVGYPNVGKSSTINAILQSKKVPVSATPGRTKHFQTLYVDQSLMLCDCPGLVMPTFVSTKAEMVVNGILPIDQMRDHVPPVNLVCQRIPRRTLEVVYGINIPKPLEGEDGSRPPTANELLNTYGYMRGYMTARGVPDCPRTARYILKDYVNGKLLFCNPPPGVSEQEFQSVQVLLPRRPVQKKQKQQTSVPEQMEPLTSSIDKEFFSQSSSKVHKKGAQSGPAHSGVSGNPDKPWKKHGNKNKKEKLKRIHGGCD